MALTTNALYPTLNRAQLSYEYLHTNSTTHEFLFGALVELVDNSRDANASWIKIYAIRNDKLRGEHMLCFLDDGCGMDRQEGSGVITFGYSSKRLNPNMIGQYGNGLKSGAMRMGQDFILFTKRNGVQTCVFLSRSFHEQEKIDEVIVPMPSFDLNKVPIVGPEFAEQERHRIELELILKYSPFNNLKDFLAQFDLIEGDSGTLVIVYNLKLLDTGDCEFDFLSDPLDIRLSDPDGRDSDLVPEKISLRAYLAVVYSDPRMKIYIRSKKVRTRRVTCSLYKPRMYKFSSIRFKARAEKDAEQARHLAKIAQDKHRDAESRLKDFEKRNGNMPTDRLLRADLRKLQDNATERKAEAKYKQDIANEKIRTLKEPKMLTFVFGLYLDRRNFDGVFVYNNGRLIKMYQKVGPQLEGGVNCLGVLAVVDIPYLVLEPTHNKQDFADAREYRQLLRAVGEHMEQYWRDLNLQADGGVLNFWQSFGYLSANWNDQPSDEEKYLKKRLMNTTICLQCDKCLKWRVLPFDSSYVGIDFADNWVCCDNSDTSLNKCSAPERRIMFPEGKLSKENVSAEQRRDQLQKKIEKQQSELKKLEQHARTTRDRNKPVTTKPMARRPSPPPKAPPKPPPKKVAPPPPPPRTPAGRRAAAAKQSSSEEESSEEEEETVRPARGAKAAPAAAKRKPIPPSSNSLVSASQRRAAMAAASARKNSAAQKKSPAALRASAALASKNRAQSNLVRPQPAPAKSPARVAAASPPASESRRSAAASEDRPARTARREPSPPPRPPSPKRTKKTTPSKDATPPIIVNSTSGEPRIKVEAESTNRIDESPLTPSNSQEPVSSTQRTDNTEKEKEEKIEELTLKFRRCVYYFLPPNWRMTKNEVSKLSTDDLLQLELPAFFTAYEQGLKMLVSEHQRATEETQEKLSQVRRMVATLLKSINQEFDIDPACDTEQVDQLLAACVQQAQSASE